MTTSTCLDLRWSTSNYAVTSNLGNTDWSKYSYATIAVAGSNTGTKGATLTLSLFGEGNSTPVTITGTGTSFYFSDHNITSITVNPDYVTSVYAFDQKLTPTEISTISAVLTPEPATATLSLLALAGLAARRRRK